MKNSLLTTLTTLTLALTLVACGRSPVERTDKGMIVHLNTSGDDSVPRLVRLNVEAQNIIRVSATRDRHFADPQSLIVTDRDTHTPFNIDLRGDTAILATEFMQAHVLTTTGEICFLYTNGDTIVQELIGGGKTFRPYEVTREKADGKMQKYSGWTTRAVFESPADEAFYGLGQHQADEWNYKGRNEELYQYNTRVSIPFVVSSKNYGLLFDTYSLCRFGNPSDYAQLPSLFTLHDKDGHVGALTGTYTAPDHDPLVRREDSLFFEDRRTVKNLPDFPLEQAHVTYEGTITPHETGQYMFNHFYSGYQRIFIDDQDVYTDDVAGTGSDNQTIWRTAWNPNSRKFSIHMEKDHPYSIRLEWTPDGDEAYCGLRAYAPTDSLAQQRLSFWSQMSQQMDYYVIVGDNTDEVIAGYRTLTGKAPIMPQWALGYWQSRERYKTQEEILSALQGFRDRHLPIDNIVLDWYYWADDDWGSFTFDPTRFASPRAMVDSIHAANAQIMISCWPKYYLTTKNFAELNDRLLIYQQSLRDSLYDWVGHLYGFYDAYDQEARQIYWRQIYENLATIGIDAWWMDASEPEILDRTDMEYRKLLCGPTAMGSSDEFLNAYSIMNDEAIYDGQRAYQSAPPDHDSQWLMKNTSWDQRGFANHFSADNQRVFILTRNGFASQQRYSTVTWSGDIGTRWEDMKAQITAGLNFSISGIPFWSQDIGGFSVEKRYELAQIHFDNTGIVSDDLRDWRELNVRWHQFGMWAPIYRSHGQFPYREPWNIAPEGSEAYNAIRSCMLLRYRLLPYIYSLAAEVYFSDYTIMRPLVMDFARDADVLNIGYQFMFGPAFMVCPIYTYKARSREVYFPKETLWYDFFTGRLASQGGETLTVDAPLDHIPIFVRSGAIIPFGKQVEYARQSPNDCLRLFVYEGDDGEFVFYEDEGTNYGYEAGRYTRIPIAYDDATHTLTIGDQLGTYPGGLTRRTFVVVPVSKDHPQAYNPDADGIEVEYTGEKITLPLFFPTLAPKIEKPKESSHEESQ